MRDPVVTVGILSALTTAASSLGIIPRIGPVRALTLAFRSKIRGSHHPISQRIQDIHNLKEELKIMEKEEYIAITGAKGIGKSCIVNTVTRYTCGVISVQVDQGDSSHLIKKSVLMSIVPRSKWDLEAEAKRVLFFYNLFARYPPIVVLQVSERLDKEKYAEIPSSARYLAELGLRVLVDGSTNSIPLETLCTKREIVLDIGPMTQETMEKIPEFKEGIAILKREDLFDAVWAVIGGVPADFKKLFRAIHRAGQKDIFVVVERFLQGMIARSMAIVDRTIAENPQKEESFKSFAKVNLVSMDSAMVLVLKHNLREAPSIKELKALICENNYRERKEQSENVAE
jgi:hypothetical protein